MNGKHSQRTISLGTMAFTAILCAGLAAYGNEPPVADAGLPRYAATDPVTLDGTGSYEPDDSGPLTYAWRQISGPPLVITGADTATPTISAFVQTEVIQECVFELVVSDQELTSPGDTTTVIVVPVFGNNIMVLENNTFDADKPTFIWFDGAVGNDLSTGGGGWANKLWEEKANIISFRYHADPGSSTGWGAGPNMTFSRCADQIIVFLSNAAPNYCQPIQTAGLSLGGVPAIDVALRLNQVYGDARYAINHVTFLDATVGVLGAEEYARRVAAFLASPVGEEQCWLDSYWSAYGGFYPSALNVMFTSSDHVLATRWYHASLSTPESYDFNGGVVAGAYWSVIGPGKNLQLASTPDAQIYNFAWDGDAYSGHMSFHWESVYQGRLPEPVTLVAWIDPSFARDDANGISLTCLESENAVGYQLLSGSDQHDVAHYSVIADSNTPLIVRLSTLPLEHRWWTVKARDKHGSTIHADPVRVDSQVESGTFLIRSDPRLVAYWRLDETEGAIAADSAGAHAGTLVGDPIWQPMGGKIDGALQLDGVDDHIRSPFVVDPGVEAIGVFAWVKGGGPGQVIVSQNKGADWLMVAADGALKTGLKAVSRFAKPLTSTAVITDGDWHQVGLVRDGSSLLLYVDDIEVAKDTQANVYSSTGGVHLGTGRTLASTSFWKGLIDDVRVHNQAIKP